MVLDNGELSELDSPENLMSKDGGMFKSLWERHQLSHGHKSQEFSITDITDERTL